MTSDSSQRHGRVTMGLALTMMLMLGACDREPRTGPPGRLPPPAQSTSELRPGPVQAREQPRQLNPYEGDLTAINEGRRLYGWFNCLGCHAAGGGGMGPALMDDKWIYGGEPSDIYASIMEGRPNGMPSFRGRIPEDDVWKIAAYVRSLAGRGTRLPEGARSSPLQEHASENLEKGSAETKKYLKESKE